jgi:hypothetical protein
MAPHRSLTTRLGCRLATAAVLWLACALTALSASAAAAVPARFLVGAASVSIDPTYPVYMGGYGGGPAGGTMARHVDPLTGRPENFTVRAIAISAHGQTVELERVDSQGWFAGYQEGPYGISDVRRAAAAYLDRHGDPSATEAEIIVSTLHEHAAPTIMGIWGPPQHALPYLKQVARAATRALEEAYAARQPATLTWGHLNVPWLDSTNLANANANEGWPNDGSLLALWARNASTGQTIATYVSEPAYPNIVYGPNDLKCPNGVKDPAVLSTDFPSYVQNYLESRLGGIALVASGTLGDQPGPMQGDSQPTTDLPPVTIGGQRCQQTVGFVDAVHMGALLGNLTTQALASGRTFTEASVAGAERYILSPVYNPLLLALNNGAPLDHGSPWAELGNPGAYPIDRSTAPPYEVANAMGTWVTGLRIGHILILSEPGEFFPSIHQAWDRSITGARGVFVVGMGQDQLGYDFPAYAYPFTWYSADQNLYNPSLTLGDQVTTAGEQVARALGFQASLTTTAEETALNNRYQQAAQSGVQFMPFQLAGDMGPPGGTFDDVFEGWATPPRFNETTPCNPPGLPSAPACPATPPTVGPIHWRFGNRTYVSDNAAQNEQSYFQHSFCTPHVYEVQATATDSSGHSHTFTLPIHVFAPLRPWIQLVRGQLTARVSGGDGRLLYAQWVTRSGRHWGASAPLPAGGPVTLRIVDGTGTTADAAAEVVNGRLTQLHGVPLASAPFADGPASPSSC